MRHHLADDGVLLVTVPMGYNALLDAAIVDHRFSCPKEFSLRRTSIDDRWVQDDVQAVHGLPYGSRFRNANAVYVGLQYGHRYSAETREATRLRRAGAPGPCGARRADRYISVRGYEPAAGRVSWSVMLT